MAGTDHPNRSCKAVRKPPNLFPSDAFSSRSVQFGGYGLFGFEFLLDQHMRYFLEAGGVGTGARADRIEGAPIYSNGFVINVGVRAQF